MHTATITQFEIHALPTAALAEVRTSGADVSGHPVVRVEATGDEPIRCCLRNALPGEHLILFGYEPPIPASPYREIGPVFAHADVHDCPGPESTTAYPDDWRGRPQVLRAYDARGWIHPVTRVHDGTDPEAIIAEMLADPDVVQIHSRNVAYGCFMFLIRRSLLSAAADERLRPCRSRS